LQLATIDVLSDSGPCARGFSLPERSDRLIQRTIRRFARELAACAGAMFWESAYSLASG
jgi:hypothetical protein